MNNLPINQQNIIAILGIENLPLERKNQILQKITGLIEKRLLIRIHDGLAEKQQAEFGQLLESGESEKLSAFLEKHVPDLAVWIAEEASQIKQELAQWLEAAT